MTGYGRFSPLPAVDGEIVDAVRGEL